MCQVHCSLWHACRISHVHCPASWPPQMEMTPQSWQEEGTELNVETVQPNSGFKAPSANLVCFWAGGPTPDDCEVLTTVTYDKMNGQTAKAMYAALAGSREDAQRLDVSE